MSRPIEFRAYDIQRCVMIRVSQMYIPHWVKGYIPDSKKHDWYEGGESEYYLRHDFELMQFTGLLDKNGKKIFEGDILKLGDFEYFIEYKDDRFWLTTSYSGDYHRICLAVYGKDHEIIGNIYDKS